MNTIRKLGVIVSTLVLAAAMGLAVALPLSAWVDTPAPAPAPASAGYPLTLFNSAIITSAKGAVFQLKDYSTVDLQYVIDVSGTNTATMTLMGNNFGSALSNSYWTTVTGVFTPTADGVGLASAPLMGRWTYLKVDLATTAVTSTANMVTLTVLGLAKTP